MTLFSLSSTTDGPKPCNIFNLAARERDASQEEKGTVDETTVLVVGAKKCGKSTIIQRFLDRTSDAPKSTLALEYTYGRKSRSNDLGKDIVHIWELGGGSSTVELIESVLTINSIEHFSCLAVLDLSIPANILPTLEALLGALKTQCDKVLSELRMSESPVPTILKKKSWANLGEDHADKALLDPLPVPVVIIGMKYDVFKDFDPEHRKVIAKSLRFMAHIHGASLFFANNRDDGLISRCKSTMNALAFKGSIRQSVSVDHNKPLVVPSGADTLAQIGKPSLLDGDISSIGARDPVDLWRTAYRQYFPPEADGGDQGQADPRSDRKYAEHGVDEMRAQKDEELERYRRQAERRARELAAKHAAKGARAPGSTKTKKPSKPSKPAGSSSRSSSRRVHAKREN